MENRTNFFSCQILSAKSNFIHLIGKAGSICEKENEPIIPDTTDTIQTNDRDLVESRDHPLPVWEITDWYLIDGAGNVIRQLSSTSEIVGWVWVITNTNTNTNPGNGGGGSTSGGDFDGSNSNLGEMSELAEKFAKIAIRDFKLKYNLDLSDDELLILLKECLEIEGINGDVVSVKLENEECALEKLAEEFLMDRPSFEGWLSCQSFNFYPIWSID